jgi:hypothetical protein
MLVKNIFISTMFICVLALSSTIACAGDAGQEDGTTPLEIDYGIIDRSLIVTAYSGGESFRFDISYTGGFKLGELYLDVRSCEASDLVDCYVINARVTTEDGIFSAIYPIEDRHVTHVNGPERLPYHYEVWQKEGYSYEAHRLVRYEQQQGRVIYKLNDGPVEVYEVGRKIHNEFSSFFASRVMPLVPGQPFIVPTFADDRRNEVVVMVRDQELLKKTVLGDVRAVVVEPIMKFSGLYDKRGDTVIWYTDDVCRVPVKVNSKLLIGSLTAELVAYKNKACPRYDGAIMKKYQSEEALLPTKTE